MQPNAGREARRGAERAAERREPVDAALAFRGPAGDTRVIDLPPVAPLVIALRPAEHGEDAVVPGIERAAAAAGTLLFRCGHAGAADDASVIFHAPVHDACVQIFIPVRVKTETLVKGDAIDLGFEADPLATVLPDQLQRRGKQP